MLHQIEIGNVILGGILQIIVAAATAAAAAVTHSGVVEIYSRTRILGLGVR